MKILIFNWRDIKNPEAGGAEVYTHEISKRWVEKGNEVTLFTSEFPGSKKEEKVDGVRIVRSGGKYSVYRKAREYYKERFSKENFDVVIDEINTRPFFTPEFVKNGEKIVALIHQLAKEYWFYETPFPISHIGYHILEKKWLRKYIDIPTVAVSNSTKKDLEELGFKKIFVVHNGLSFEPVKKIPKKEKDPTIIYLGRLNKAKRPDHALKAFEIVKKYVPKSKLWFVGDGYLRKSLDNSKNRNVKFFGHVSDETKKELLSKSWLLVNPSVREGWGINIIEANACGTPAVAYNVPGLKDSIVNNQSGLLAEDPHSLVTSIVKILDDSKLRRKLSEYSISHSRKFNWDYSSSKMLNLLESL